MNRTAHWPSNGEQVANPSESLTVYKIGTTVIAGSVTAMVLQVNISENHRVQYEVVWWTADERKSAWVSENEVKPTEHSETVSMGFK